MKTAQWVAVLCVSAGIVFGLTFLANYLGGRGGTGKGAKTAAAPQAELTWADNVTNFPNDPSRGPAECEIEHPQSHDFWFKNENAQTLPVGVLSNSCQCTSVQLWLAKNRTDIPAAADREKAEKELEEAGPPAELKDKEGGVDVPAGAVGMVRLSWPGGRAGAKDLAAELWMGEKGPGPVRRFVIRTVFVEPLRVAPRHRRQRAAPGHRFWRSTPRETALPAYLQMLVADAKGLPALCKRRPEPGEGGLRRVRGQRSHAADRGGVGRTA